MKDEVFKAHGKKQPVCMRPYPYRIHHPCYLPTSHSFALATLFFGVLLLPGCLWVSDPDLWPNDFIDRTSLPMLVGKREQQVLEKLGTPTFVAHTDEEITYIYQSVDKDWAYSVTALPLDIVLVTVQAALGINNPVGVGEARGNEVNCVLLAFNPNGVVDRYEIKTQGAAEALQGHLTILKESNCPNLFGIAPAEFISGNAYVAAGNNLEAAEEFKQYLSIAPDDSSRFRHLCKAADLGHPSAQIEVGRHLMQGDFGVQKDLPRAYVWYLLGSSGQSDTHLQLLSEQMTREQIAEAKKMLPDWKPGQCMQDLTLDQDEQEVK
jgi:outer membrane protein assembly factor BamE (lipoprotein component of BamABCDE complex)